MTHTYEQQAEPQESTTNVLKMPPLYHYPFCTQLSLLLMFSILLLISVFTFLVLASEKS